jgi:4-hydroxy-tetrahydrodipicolinate synthase
MAGARRPGGGSNMAAVEQPHGIYPMLYAFFGADGRLDRGAVRAEVEAVVGQGVHGLAVGGLGSETNKLATGERRQLMEWTLEAVGGRVPVCATVAENTAEGQVEMVRAASALGAAWVILQPPPVPGASEDALIRFFGSVADRSEVPVGIQNAPQFIGIGLSDAGLLELHRRHPNVSIVKAEGPASTCIAPLAEAMGGATGGTLRLFNGRAGIDLTDSLRAGCHGLIPGGETCDVQAAIYELMRAGEADEADRRFAEILPLLSFLMLSIDQLICYGKRLAARRLGMSQVHDRTPAQAPTDFGLRSLARWSRGLAPF